MTLRPLHAALLAVALAGGCGGASAGGEQGEGGKGGKSGWGGKGGKGDWGGKGGKGGAKGEDALPVAVIHATPATVERFYRTSGTLEALRSADLVATQAGVILDISAEEGDHVEEDQVLARLDGRAFKLQASRDSVTAKNAEAELRRLEAIAALDAVSREELDKQRYAVEQALASVKVSRHQVAQTKVFAPFSGTIVARHVDVGNMATQATPLFSIADMSKLDLDLHIPEAEAGEVQVGSEVDLELLDGSTFRAKVIRRAPIVDALTGTVKFVARAEEFPSAAIPGAFTRAKVRVAAREAGLSLPNEAIFDYEGKPHVYTVEAGKVRRVQVELGLRGEARVEITGGLDPSAQVIADAGRGIVEGMPVRPLSEDGSAGETGAAGALGGGKGKGDGAGAGAGPGARRGKRGEGKSKEAGAGKGKEN
ncbi:MAG: efflux RND transporter periplasmic adaptor subunit [Myxococcales bacterium]|nr:efflux RND transporter periplasmic adaptor subunit [Myxococcales bacterium]